MKKIVINKCHGGFGLSDDAMMRYSELAGLELVKDDYDYYYFLKDKNFFHVRHIERDDKYLIQVVEEMGNMANGGWAELKVVTIPNDVEWQIEEYDGYEHIAEKHKTWE